MMARLAIRKQRGVERQVDTAARFGVSQVLISKIQRGSVWSHIETESASQ